jgi:glycosyltransferase involved in cell wall biosynthesis
MQIIVEGWRFLTHSFAIANQYQLLELLRRSHVQLFHRDMPYFDENWQTQYGLFAPDEEIALRQIPSPPPGQWADVVLRMSLPYNLKPAAAKRTCVFGTTEWGIVQKLMLNLMGVSAFWDAHRNTETRIITPSNWSREGFLRSGADPHRTVVVPHGVDNRTFVPLPPEQRQALRQHFGLDDCFVFLNIGVMTWNKGIRPMLKAFAAVVERYPHARLILKGTEAIRRSRDFIVSDLKTILTDAEIDRVVPRIAYIGKSMSAGELAQLHQIADIYLAPYIAEGFNMPVLEAMSCGLPIICTQGGPTDDFTRSEWTFYIQSRLETMEVDHETRFYLNPDLEHLIELMGQAIEQPEFRQKAARLSPQFVAQHYTWAHIIDRLLATIG